MAKHLRRARRFGLAVLAAVAFAMRETRPPEVAQRARMESALRAYAAIVGSRRTMGYVAINGLNYGSLFAWITAARSS